MRLIHKFGAILLIIEFVITTPATPSLQTMPEQPVSKITVQQFISESDSRNEKSHSESIMTNCVDAKYRRFKFLVSFGVINARAIDLPEPNYPAVARAVNASGEVKVSIVVSERGSVAWAHIDSGHPLLQTAVKKVVCRARFKPQILSGSPVAVRGIIVYNFISQ